MKRILLTYFFSYVCFIVFSQSPSVYTRLEASYHAGNFDECLRMEKEVRSFAANRLDTLASNSFFYLGDACNQTGDIKKALGYFEKSKDILESLGMSRTAEVSNTLSNLAYLYLTDGQYELAGTAADELVARDRKLYSMTAPEWIESVLGVTDIYIPLDRLRDAERLLLQTLKVQHDHRHNRGLILNKLGELYSYTGEYRRASESLLEALDIHWETSGEESAEYINTAINLGILYMNQGKYPEAEEIFEVALTKVNPSEPAYPSLLNNQALVLQSLGQLERAEKTLHHIRRIDSAAVGVQHPDFAITLSNLGLVYADLGQPEKAAQVLTNALSIQKSNGESNTVSYARKLNNLAKVYGMTATSEKSLPLLKQALSIFRKNMGKESPEYATSAYNLGVALWCAGKPDEGFRYLKISADIRANVLGKNHPKHAESMQKIGEYHWHHRSIEKARASFGEVFENHYFQIDETFPVLTEEEKTKFYYTNIRPTFDVFNSFALSHYTGHPGLVDDVFNYLINTKGAIMSATEKVRAAIRTSGDTTLIRQFEIWETMKEQVARSYSQNQEHTQLDSLLAEAHRMEKEIARKSAAFEGQFMRRTMDRKQVQARLKPGEAAVEVLRYEVYDPQAGGRFKDEIRYAFLVITPETGQDPFLIEVPGGRDLEMKFLRFYRNNIRFQLEDVASYTNYFKPLADYLKAEEVGRIFFSPDGVYNQININSLLNPETREFAIDEFDIRIVTNTRELVEAAPDGQMPRTSALIGFPKFNLDDIAPTNGPQKNGTRSVNRRWRGGLLRYMRGEGGISILPGTELEIEKIARLFGEDSDVYTQEKATEEVVRNIDNPGVLHIATHGYFLEDESRSGNTKYFSNPMLNAGLILAGAENFLRIGQPLNEAGDDGILTAYEAMNLRLDDTKLVVLSACETALGDVRNGEGVYGLQRAFKLAGTQSIVMSLWSVDDAATQQMMTAFYQEMVRSGDQHAAFRLAQKAVKEKYASPFYWGAFIMVGI